MRMRDASIINMRVEARCERARQKATVVGIGCICCTAWDVAGGAAPTWGFEELELLRRHRCCSVRRVTGAVNGWGRCCVSVNAHCCCGLLLSMSYRFLGLSWLLGPSPDLVLYHSTSFLNKSGIASGCVRWHVSSSFKNFACSGGWDVVGLPWISPLVENHRTVSSLCEENQKFSIWFHQNLIY